MNLKDLGYNYMKNLQKEKLQVCKLTQFQIEIQKCMVQ